MVLMSQRIFCVDDSRDMREMIRDMVENLGHEFLGGVSSIDELCSWLQVHKAKDITIAIINLSLESGLIDGRPDESGKDAERILREAGFRGGVVWTTSWPTKALSEEVWITEFPIIQKPFCLEGFNAALFIAALTAA